MALLGTFGWGTFAAALVPVVAIGFNWKRATALAANVAIISGLAINFGILLLKRQGLVLPYSLSGESLALLVSLTLFFLISMLSTPQPLDPDVEAVMEM